MKKKIIKDLSDEMNLLAEYPFYDEEAAAKGYVSVTQLLDTDRIFHLTRRHKDEIVKKASSVIVPQLGSVFHLGMELVTSNNANYINEIRMFTPFIVGDQTIIVSGKFDCLKVTQDKLGKTEITKLKLIDYKETSVFKLGKNEAKIDWGMQLSIYRYMLMHPETEFEVTDENQHQIDRIKKLIHEENININSLEIQYRARDWRSGEALRNKMIHRYYPDKVGKIELDIYDINYIKEFILRKLFSLISQEDLKDDALPLCTPHERWQRITDFAVFKGENVKATKCFRINEFDNETLAEEAAMAYVDNHASGKLMKIVKRETESRKCLEYCDVRDHCNFGKQLMKEKEKNNGS